MSKTSKTKGGQSITDKNRGAARAQARRVAGRSSAPMTEKERAAGRMAAKSYASGEGRSSTRAKDMPVGWGRPKAKTPAPTKPASTPAPTPTPAAETKRKPVVGKGNQPAAPSRSRSARSTDAPLGAVARTAQAALENPTVPKRTPKEKTVEDKKPTKRNKTVSEIAKGMTGTGRNYTGPKVDTTGIYKKDAQRAGKVLKKGAEVAGKAATAALRAARKRREAKAAEAAANKPKTTKAEDLPVYSGDPSRTAWAKRQQGKGK